MKILGKSLVVIGLFFLLSSGGDVLAHTSAWGNPYAGYTRVVASNGTSSTQQVPQAPNQGVTSTASRNWSGYVSTSGTYTEVNGTWTVPSISNTNTRVAADATWVGIGGMSGQDLLQAGTQAIVENGQVQYQAWYETLPNASQTVSLTVSPGDSVTATIAETAQNVWLVTLSDNTTGKSYSTTVNYQSSESSAEWIEEMPSDTSNSFLPLDSFGSVNFTGAQTVKNGQVDTIAQANSYALTMTDGVSVLASTSALNADGQSFTVTRSNVASSQSTAIQTMPAGFARRGHRIQEFTVPTATVTPTSGSSGQTQTFSEGPFTVTITYF